MLKVCIILSPGSGCLPAAVIAGGGRFGGRRGGGGGNGRRRGRGDPGEEGIQFLLPVVCSHHLVGVHFVTT